MPGSAATHHQLLVSSTRPRPPICRALHDPLLIQRRGAYRDSPCLPFPETNPVGEDPLAQTAFPRQLRSPLLPLRAPEPASVPLLPIHHTAETACSVAPRPRPRLRNLVLAALPVSQHLAVIAIFLACFHGLLVGSLGAGEVGWGCVLLGVAGYVVRRVGWGTAVLAQPGMGASSFC